MGKMSGGPTGCHPSETLLKIGPIAKARAGSVNPIVISAPALCTVPVMNRRRVTVSPSNAPGMPRSAVYLDLLGLRVGGNDAPEIPGDREEYLHALADGSASARS